MLGLGWQGDCTMILMLHALSNRVEILAVFMIYIPFGCIY